MLQVQPSTSNWFCHGVYGVQRKSLLWPTITLRFGSRCLNEQRTNIVSLFCLKKILSPIPWDKTDNLVLKRDIIQIECLITENLHFSSPFRNVTSEVTHNCVEVYIRWVLFTSSTLIIAVGPLLPSPRADYRSLAQLSVLSRVKKTEAVGIVWYSRSFYRINSVQSCRETRGSL